jgi:hypothetical protein
MIILSFKVKMSLCLSKHCNEDVSGIGSLASHTRNLGLAGIEWSVFFFFFLPWPVYSWVAWWTPEPIWTWEGTEKSVSPSRNRLQFLGHRTDSLLAVLIYLIWLCLFLWKCIGLCYNIYSHQDNEV